MSQLIKLRMDQIEEASIILRDAFQNDPVWGYVFKEDSNRDRALKAFFIMPLLYAYRYGQIYATSDNLEGVVAFVDDRKSKMSFARLLMCGAIQYGTHMDQSSIRKLSFLSKLVEPRKKEHMKGKVYIHLTIIGVKKDYQKQGFGKELIQSVIAKADALNAYVYLETETCANVRLYEQFGFRVIDQVSLAPHVPLWLMERAPL